MIVPLSALIMLLALFASLYIGNRKLEHKLHAFSDSMAAHEASSKHGGCPVFVDDTLRTLLATNNSVFGYSHEAGGVVNWLTILVQGFFNETKLCGELDEHLATAPHVSLLGILGFHRSVALAFA